MRMSFQYLSSPLEFKFKNIQVLVIENKPLYRNVIQSLSEKKDDCLVFSQSFKPFTFSKKGLFIADSINISLQDKKIQTQGNYEMERILNETMFSELVHIQEMMSALGQKLAEESDFDFSFSGEINASELVKMLRFSLRYEDSKDQLDNLLLYIKACNRYLGIRHFIIANLFLYFTDKELAPFFDTLKLHKLTLLILENARPQNIEGCGFTIVDNDLCEIVDENIDIH